MQIAILGRQSNISLAELERIFKGNIKQFSESSAVIDSDQPVDIQKLGGTKKLGLIKYEIPSTSWRDISNSVSKFYSKSLVDRQKGKLTLGISVYDANISPRDIQKLALGLKTKLKQSGVNLRIIPNKESVLSTATSHHNKLGLAENKIELLVVIGEKRTLIAESTGTQNITALARRDQGRPKRDAFVGMLPPKLAQIMINLSTGGEPIDGYLLDPFCGTGVLLQEALLMGYDVYGTDLADKMIDYSEQNLKWLADQTHHPLGEWSLDIGDATETTWPQPLSTVATETYLGQPFSAPPSPQKLTQVKNTCNNIVKSFLKNLHHQLPDDCTICIAVPAWRDASGHFTKLPLIGSFETLGYELVSLKSTDASKLIYYRPDQVVARQLLILTKTA